MSCKCDVNVYMKYGEISKLKAHDLGLSSVDILVGKSSRILEVNLSSSIFLSLSLSLQAFALVETEKGVLFLSTKSWCSFKRGHLALKFTETII